MNLAGPELKVSIFICGNEENVLSYVSEVKENIIADMERVPIEWYLDKENYSQRCELSEENIVVDCCLCEDIDGEQKFEFVKSDIYFLIGDVSCVNKKKKMLRKLSNNEDEFDKPIIITLCQKNNNGDLLSDRDVYIEFGDDNFNLKVKNFLYHFVGIWYLPILISVDPGDFLCCFGGKKVKCEIIESKILEEIKRFDEIFLTNHNDILRSPNIFLIFSFNKLENYNIDNISDISLNIHHDEWSNIYFCDFGFTGIHHEGKNKMIFLYE